MRISEHTVDLAVLTRDETPISEVVMESIRNQKGINVRLHRVVGTPRPDDPHRIATIARARNEAVRRARSPWLMFLDDDVVLAPDCIARLHHALASRPDYAALAADYLGERVGRKSSQHVAMGATMFRRSALNRTTFRWEPFKCECLCCCEDLRRTGSRVEYLAGAKAWHLENEKRVFSCDIESSQPAFSAVSKDGLKGLIDDDTSISNGIGTKEEEYIKEAKVLVAFNRRDVRRFRDIFLSSLRRWGNDQDVIAVAYGVYPSELRMLSRCEGVQIVEKTYDGRMPPVRRLEDFAAITESLKPNTPVAYWDASDVIIQSSLDPLWQMTQQSPGKIFGVREPLGYPHNAAISGWTRTIEDPKMRRRAFDLFSSQPFLNSGFSAGTAAAMNHYFVEATRLRSSAELQGTTDWGDQTAFNLYCHTNRDRWQEVAESWNYCVHDRPVGEVHVTPDGRVTCQSGTPIYAVHGNARSLAKLALVR